MADYNFFGPNQNANAQWGVGTPQWGLGTPADYSSMSNWGAPDTSGTPGNPMLGFGTSAAAGAGAPAAGSAAGSFGLNVPTFQLGLGALSTLGNLWGAFNAQSTAKDALNFQKNMAQKNLSYPFQR